MTTTSDARKRLAEAQGPHAGCVPGQCRAGDQWRTTGCDDQPSIALDAATVAAAIARVEKSRQTHVEWREHWHKYEAHTCSETPCPWEAGYADEQAIAGDVAHQEEAIAGYDTVLTVLRWAASAAEPLAQALAAVEAVTRVETVVAAMGDPMDPTHMHPQTAGLLDLIDAALRPTTDGAS